MSFRNSCTRNFGSITIENTSTWVGIIRLKLLQHLRLLHPLIYYE
jgi:hypothetical protein